MKILNINLYNNNNIKTHSMTTPLKPDLRTEENSEVRKMPAIAPNYMANISFKSHLNMEEIAKYTLDMGKRIYSKRNVTELAQIHEQAGGITLGRGLPQEWLSRIKDIDNFAKDEFVTEFGKIFAKEREFANMDVLRERLSALLQKHKIIDADTPFSVRYIGKGFQAWAYRIGIGTDEDSGIVTKLFKRTYNHLQNHGNHTEQNLAEYVKKYAGDRSEFVKYYYGDTKNGIMTVDYLSPNIKEPEHVLDLEDIGVHYGDDYAKNRVKRRICDFGGIETKNNLVGNPVAQDVYAKIKYANNETKRVKLFNEINSQRNDEEFYDKAIGLVHSIKYLPEEMQSGLYNEFYEIGSHRVNIALIQNIKNFKHVPENNALIEKLCTTTEQKEQETIAKEIKDIPDKIRHRIFEEYSDTKVSAIIKYLARNINHYYRDLANRRNIYEKFMENCDTYSGIALINSMKYMGPSSYDKYFEKFYSMNNPIINTTLARSLEVLSEDPKVQQKWINKLLEYDDVDVKTALCESVSYVDDSLKVDLFDELLSVKDHVAKEFLAQNITTVPGYNRHRDWIPRLLDGADNMVRGSLANTIKSLKNADIKKDWTEKVLQGADSSIKEMLGA